jgi:DNA-binding NtrC family response regulator
MTAPACHICLIEDDEILGEALGERLALEGYACDWYRTGHAALRALTDRQYDVVLSDIRLPDLSGQALFEQLLAEGRRLPPFVFITGHGAIDDAVRLLKLGAEDYLTKPFEVAQLLVKLRRICQRQPPLVSGGGALGISSAMRDIEAMLPRLAASSGTVLITGESGVGKEVVTRALHSARDPQDRRPFVPVNCGAITESLMEAELFGHEKGAFTGALRERRGLFEQAHGGTLFFDEIGEMPLAMQVKLLRAIQDRAIVRVGGEKSIALNIALVCATHQDLRAMVERGEFREDLYYRIHVIHLHVPPLRERKEDILWLADQFLDKLGGPPPAPRRRLHPLAERALADYPWPGNVRELRHSLERACILSSNATLTVSDLFGEQPPTAGDVATPETLAEYLCACERRYIGQALSANDWHIAETAASLGITRKNLWEKMKKLGIQEAEG